MVRLAFMLFVAAGVIAATPAEADPVSEGIATLPGAVEDVRIGGSWQMDGKSGVYRILIARAGGDAVTARLFVQWIAYGEAGTATVEESLEVSEFADLELDIIDYTSESDAEGLAVYIESIDPQGGGDEQFELFVFAPNDYRFGPATN